MNESASKLRKRSRGGSYHATPGPDLVYPYCLRVEVTFPPSLSFLLFFHLFPISWQATLHAGRGKRLHEKAAPPSSSSSSAPPPTLPTNPFVPYICLPSAGRLDPLRREGEGEKGGHKIVWSFTSISHILSFKIIQLEIRNHQNKNLSKTFMVKSILRSFFFGGGGGKREEVLGLFFPSFFPPCDLLLLLTIYTFFPPPLTRLRPTAGLFFLLCRSLPRWQHFSPYVFF